MATLTGRTIANTYKNLLNIDNDNAGVDGSLRTVQDGEGTNTVLQLSQTALNINGDFYINGSQLNSTAEEIDSIVDNTFTEVAAGTGIRIEVDASVSGSIRTSGTIMVSANQNFATVSVSTGLYSTGVTYLSVVSAANIDADELLVGGVSVANVTELAAVSALTSVNLAAVTSINTVTDTINSAITSINSAYTSVSAALETRIAAVSVLTSVNLAAITSINSAYTSVSAALESRIAAVSALTSVNLAAIASVSTALETRIAAVSVLTSVNLEATTSITTRITALSATMATSIANHLPLAGGTITGTVSAEEVVVSSLEAKANVFGTQVSLTDGASIAVAMDTGNHFVVQLAGNRTLAAPTGLQPSQVGSITIIQDGTGSRTLSYNAVWKFPGGTAPTLSTGASAVDRIDFEVYTSTQIHAVATLDMQ